MKRKLLLSLLGLLLGVAASAQSMKVYQNGELKAIYYVSKDDEVVFSDDFPFPDEGEQETIVNGHKAIDLGLSVKWADMNVGATTPEGYGEYYAWGETEPKAYYDWSTYFDSVNGSSSNFKKYYNGSGKTTLDPEDDAAHVNWGGDWRMPTRAEQDELRNSCTWTWTTQNGVKGYKVTSKSNGNSIFLPAAGYRLEGSLYDVGSFGGYWSSSLLTSYSNYAYGLYFGSGGVGWGYYYRYYGRSVRAVCQ